MLVRLQGPVCRDRVPGSMARAYDSVNWFLTRQLLRLNICTVPAWNEIWGLTDTGAHWNPHYFDRNSCWKGMGMSGCNNEHGYWYLR